MEDQKLFRVLSSKVAALQPAVSCVSRSLVLQNVPINAHATWQPRSVEREQWRPKGRQGIITALTT